MIFYLILACPFPLYYGKTPRGRWMVQVIFSLISYIYTPNG